MATAKKAAPKPGTAGYKPAEGVCRHRNVEKIYDCATAVDREGWTWCLAHVKAHRAATSKPRSAAAKPKATRNAPAKGKVVPMVRKPAPAPERKVHPRIAALVEVTPEVTKVE